MHFQNARFARLLAVFLLPLLLTGCLFGTDNTTEPRPVAQPAGGAEMRASEMALDRSQFGERRIDETHTLNLALDGDELRARHQRDFDKCVELGCEILSSSVQSSTTGDAASNATLNARISPDKLRAYLTFLSEGPGRLESHQVSATDRTLDVIDTAAKLENLEALKTRLRSLLDSGKAEGVEDILRIEKELARLQQEIDQVSGRQRHLEKITTTAAVNVGYYVRYGAIEVNYEALTKSFDYAWSGFIENLAHAIFAVGVVIPWIVFGLIAGWIATRLYRFAFRKKTAPPAA
jgi:hypothetical protein